MKINESKTSNLSKTYEYSFTTDADTIYIDASGCCFSDNGKPSMVFGGKSTLTNLSQHHTIRILVYDGQNKYDD